MSRTDAHTPTWLRDERGEIPEFSWFQICWCRLCYRPQWRRDDLRHERRRARRRLVVVRDRWGAGERDDADGVLTPVRRASWWC